MSNPTNQTKPNQTQTIQINPNQTKPIKISPNQTQPIQTKPNQTKPIKISPNQTKPNQIKPNLTNPDQIKPHQTQPIHTKPNQTSRQLYSVSVPLYPVSWWLVDEEAGEEAHTQVDTAQDQQQVRHPAQQLRVYEVPEYRLCLFIKGAAYEQYLYSWYYYYGASFSMEKSVNGYV